MAYESAVSGITLNAERCVFSLYLVLVYSRYKGVPIVCDVWEEQNEKRAQLHGETREHMEEL